MAGTYQSARTLEKGTSSVGMTFSFVTYQYTDTSTGDKTTFALPNLIPELTYHIGVSDDVTVGGRVALGSLGLEGDVKFRILHTDKLHMALDPSIGYQAAFLIQGGTLRLPAILTYDLADNFSFNAAVFGATSHFSNIDNGAAYQDFNGTLVSTGAAVGFDLRAATFVIRPMVEWSRYVADFSSNPDFQGFNTFNVMVHVAWIGGREKKQLNRMERKLDRVMENQGQNPQEIKDDSDYGPMK